MKPDTLKTEIANIGENVYKEFIKGVSTESTGHFVQNK